MSAKKNNKIKKTVKTFAKTGFEGYINDIFHDDRKVATKANNLFFFLNLPTRQLDDQCLNLKVKLPCSTALSISFKTS